MPVTIIRAADGLQLSVPSEHPDVVRLAQVLWDIQADAVMGFGPVRKSKEYREQMQAIYRAARAALEGPFQGDGQ